MNQPLSILKEISQSTPSSDLDTEEYDESAEYRAFGISRKATNSEPMIDFISKTGARRSFAYSHLYSVEFNGMIELEFTDHIVSIRGRSLRECYKQLLRHRIVFIAEADIATPQLLQRNHPLVNELRIMKKHVDTNCHLNA